MKQNRGRGHRIFSPNKLDLTFHAANHRAEFHENGIKIAAVGAHTDASDFIICPKAPCYAIAMGLIIKCRPKICQKSIFRVGLSNRSTRQDTILPRDAVRSTMTSQWRHDDVKVTCARWRYLRTTKWRRITWLDRKKSCYLIGALVTCIWLSVCRQLPVTAVSDWMICYVATLPVLPVRLSRTKLKRRP